MIEVFQSFINANDFSIIKVYLFGKVAMFDLLLLAMGVDIITGIMKAWKNKRLRSRSGYYGYLKKIATLALIIVANIIDQMCSLNGWFASASVAYYLLNELISIVENANELGVKVLPGLADKLHVLQNNNEEQKK